MILPVGTGSIDIHHLGVAEAHDRPFAEVLGDLLDRELKVFVAGDSDFVFLGFFFGFCSHGGIVVCWSGESIRAGLGLRSG